MTTPSEEMRGLIHQTQARKREMASVSIQTLRRWADAWDTERGLTETARRIVMDLAYTDEAIDAGTVYGPACDWAKAEYELHAGE